MANKKGFDVWYHKGDIDFQKCKAAGIDFILPRDGWDTNAIDYKFVEYVQQALAAGIEVPGVFHFIYAKDIAEAIQNADQAMANVKAAGLPQSTIIWCDFENDTIDNARDYRGTVLTTKDIVEMTKAFCNRCLAEGYPTGVYTSQWWVANIYGVDFFKEYDLWLADLEGDPGYPCVYRQYSWKGTVPGCNEYLDLDEYYGNYTAGTALPRNNEKEVEKKEVKTVSTYQIMTDNEWVEKLKTLARGKSNYKNVWPYNLLYWTGDRFTADCSNLEKALFNGRNIEDKTVGSFQRDLSATGDCTEYGLLIQCSDVQWGNFQNLKPGDPRILYMEGHIGAYLGEEWEEPGQGIVNAVESTGRWEDGIQFSFVAPDGARSWCKGAQVVGYWEAHGLASKWIIYTDDDTQIAIDTDKAAVAPEIAEEHTTSGQHYGTKDLAVCIIRGKLGKGYENRVNNAAALGYSADEVRSAQDLVNVVVAKANEQKAAAEQALTVITAAYDVIAGKYGDGQTRKDALIEKFGADLQQLIRAKVEELLA